MISRLVVSCVRQSHQLATARTFTTGCSPRRGCRRWLSTTSGLRAAGSKPPETSNEAAARKSRDAAGSGAADADRRLMLNAVDAEQRRLIRDVKALAKWKDSVANVPASSEKDNAAIRSTLEQVLENGSPPTKRLAALYVTKCALSVPPHGIRTPLAERAISIVERLSLQKDPEAMVLVGRLLEQSRTFTLVGNQYKASQLYEAAIKMVNQGAWTKAPANQIIVGPADALCAFGSLNYNSKYSGNEAKEALDRAVKKYSHLESCKFLEGQYNLYSAERYDCLLRMAMSGYYPAAKAIGDIACSNDREFAKYDDAVREDLAGCKSWLWTSETLEDGKDDPPEAVMAGSKRWISRAATVPLPQEPETLDETRMEHDCVRAAMWYSCAVAPLRLADSSKDAARAWAEDARTGVQHLTMAILETQERDVTNGRPSPLAGPSCVRFSKAIDWYLLAAIGGHVPAMTAGLQLCGSTFEVWPLLQFDRLWKQLPQAERERHSAESVVYKSLDKKIAPIVGWFEDYQVIGDDRVSKLNMDQLIVFGHV